VREIERARPRWSAGRVYGQGRAAEAVARVVAGFLGRSAREGLTRRGR
jgi:hypothetical protein